MEEMESVCQVKIADGKCVVTGAVSVDSLRLRMEVIRNQKQIEIYGRQIKDRSELGKIAQYCQTFTDIFEYMKNESEMMEVDLAKRAIIIKAMNPFYQNKLMELAKIKMELKEVIEINPIHEILQRCQQQNKLGGDEIKKFILLLANTFNQNNAVIKNMQINFCSLQTTVHTGIKNIKQNFLHTKFKNVSEMEIDQLREQIINTESLNEQSANINAIKEQILNFKGLKEEIMKVEQRESFIGNEIKKFQQSIQTIRKNCIEQLNILRSQSVVLKQKIEELKNEKKQQNKYLNQKILLMTQQLNAQTAQLDFIQNSMELKQTEINSKIMLCEKQLKQYENRIAHIPNMMKLSEQKQKLNKTEQN